MRHEAALFTSFYLASLTRGAGHLRGGHTWPRISRFDDRWCWLVASVVPRFRRFDDDRRLIDPSLRRILAQARAFATMPCVLPLPLQTQVARHPFG